MGEWDLSILLFINWNDLVLGSVETFSGSRCIRVSETSHQICLRVIFAEFEWKYHNSLNTKTGEWALKLLLFNYCKDLVWGSIETYFLEVGAYVSLKRATTGLSEARFCWIWVKMLQFFKYKNGGVGPTDFTVKLLKWSCLGLSRNIISGSRCKHVSEISQRRCLRGLYLQNLSENFTIF